MNDLGTLSGCERSQVLSLNNAGAAVGIADLCAGSARAFLFTKKAGLVDLNAIAPAADGFTYSRPTAINNAGTIVGVAVGPDGFSTRPFLLVRDDD